MESLFGSVVSPKDSRYNGIYICVNLYHTNYTFFQFSYDIPKSQVQSIRAGSRHASQNFRYICHNSAASVIFRTNNGKEISATDTLYNGCQVYKNRCYLINTHVYNILELMLMLSLHIQSTQSLPDVSILEVNTRKVNQLPLKDFAATDISSGSWDFGFVMGPACFY